MIPFKSIILRQSVEETKKRNNFNTNALHLKTSFHLLISDRYFSSMEIPANLFTFNQIYLFTCPSSYKQERYHLYIQNIKK